MIEDKESFCNDQDKIALGGSNDGLPKDGLGNTKGNRGDLNDPRIRLKRDCVGVMAAFKLKNPSQHFVIVANSDFYWDPELADVKLAQAKYLLSRASKFKTLISNTYKCSPSVIIAGDFNSLPGDKEGTTTGTTLLFAVFLSSMTLGTILMCFLRKRDGKEEKGSEDSSVGLWSSVISLSKSVIEPLYDVRLLLIIPLIIYSGLQAAFVWAEFTKYIVEPSLGEPGVGGAMAVFGVFDALCSLAAGRLTSGLTSITFIVSGGAFFQAVVLVGILLKYSVNGGAFGMVYTLLIAALWGIGDGVLNTQLNALLAILFKRNTIPTTSGDDVSNEICS